MIIRRVNRIVAICVALILITISASVVMATPKMTLTVENVIAEAGTDVEVPVVLSGNSTGVLAMQLSLSYDNRLSFKSIEQGEALSTLDLTPIKDFSANPCTILLDGLDADTSNGKIIILTFTVPADITGDFDVCLSYKVGEIYDHDMNDIDVSVVNGSIKVTESSSTENTGNTILVGTHTKTANSIKLDVYASSPDELTGTIIAALYDNEKCMKTVELYTAEATVNITLNSVDGKYIKVMWWNMDTLEPLADSVEVNLN